MARIAPLILRRYILGGQLSTGGCRHVLRSSRHISQSLYARRDIVQSLHASPDSAVSDPTIPFRKQLKDETKRRKAEGRSKQLSKNNPKLHNWELTIGIEIHAQLNTARKLFSNAASSINEAPNTNVALFDVAMPGSQPVFQKETLIPALRAALALNCQIQKTSKFDRKHYFHWDQPAGYQITQYYEPFAKDGYINLYAHDGIAKEDGDQVRVGIKQIQMEQDTAKTISQPGDVRLLDFNRVGLPLIEIITLPQIHHPSTAAALVRKIQILLNAVDACVLGMQSGGLRADINVSVRRRDSDDGSHEYAGVQGLGQRTEIKNLSSFKAVEEAIIAERDRQIEVLEAGGVIEGETRGWTIGSTETRRLRGKEGEVDYRYMPDPDLEPLVIGDDLLAHLQATTGVLPDDEIDILVDDYGLTVKDALSLVSLDNGGRVEYFRNVVDDLLLLNPEGSLKGYGRLCANWTLHEMGGLAHTDADEENVLRMTPEGKCIILSKDLASLLYFLDGSKITGKTAKAVLVRLFENGLSGHAVTVERIIDEEGWWFTPLTDSEYEEFARAVLDMKVVGEILAGKAGKINFLLGQMMRRDQDGRMDPQQALSVLRLVVEEHRK